MLQFKEYITGYIRYRDLVLNMVKRDLKLRFQGTSIGFAWSLGLPLVMISLYGFVFGSLFQSKVENFVLYLIVGLLHYNLLNQVVTQGIGSLLGSARLLQRIHFPRILVPTANVISSFIVWSASIIILIVALPLLGGHYTWLIIPYLGMLMLYLVMLWGIALCLSVLVVEFRDLRHLVEIGLILLFWLTPIVYDPSGFKPNEQLLINLNPFTHFILCFRDILYFNKLPGIIHLSIAVLWTVFCVTIGLALFRRKVRWLVELL